MMEYGKKATKATKSSKATVGPKKGNTTKISKSYATADKKMSGYKKK